jgi:outer membrane protein with beta-barrel domain
MHISAVLARSILILAAVLPLTPSLAAAQPRRGQIALGGDVGWFVPSDEQFDAAPIFGGFLEGYAAPRLGIRGSLFVTAPEFERGNGEEERQMRIGLDAIYNWEGGKIHPFLGGGLGIHMLQLRDDGHDVGDSDSKLGFSLLGGLEYFLNRRWTVKGEGRYQWVDNPPFIDPDGFALTIGLKRYF